MGNPGLARALALFQGGRLNEAASVCRTLCQEFPTLSGPHHLLGVIEYQCGRFEASVGHLQRALALGGMVPRLMANLGTVLRSAGRLQEARSVCEATLERDASLVEARLALALSCSELGDHSVASAHLERALEDAPEVALTHFARGLHAGNQGRHEDAILAYQEALRLQPDYAEASHNIGRALRDLGRFGEAEWYLRRALQLRPEDGEAHLALSRLLLLQELWEEGWSHYEWRHRCKRAPVTRSTRPTWEGEDLADGTLLIEAEQGLGDAIQFARYAAAVKPRASRVVYAVPPKLVRLLSGVEGIDGVIPNEGALPRHEARIFAMSLPRFFGEPLGARPYLRAESERVRAWALRLPPKQGLRIAVNWQGNPSYPEDARRSFPLELLAPLGRVPGVEVLSVQRGHGSDQVRNAAFRVVTPLGDRDECHAFVDTAAILHHCDLVVTSDTALAHLAGALGRPTWLALAAAPEWRWGATGTRTPWYESMRLYRQDTLGEWNPVFERMGADLSAVADEADPARWPALLMEGNSLQRA